MQVVSIKDKNIELSEKELLGGVFERIYKENTCQDVYSHSSYGITGITQEFRNVEKMCIGILSRKGYCFSPYEKVENIYEIMKTNPSITSFTIVDNMNAVGFLTRTAFNEKLGGQYGFSLYSKNTIQEIMETDFLLVDHKKTIDQVSFLAMQRSFEQLYNPIVVVQNGKYSGVVTIKDLLDTCTKIALAERNEIALMRDNLKIGIFFMNSKYIIQDQYSSFLEELFSLKDFNGKSFIDLLSASANTNELNSIKDYFDIIFEGKFDQNMIDEINPLTEFYYNSTNNGSKKVFHCNFAAIKHDNGEILVLVSVYDITARIELKQKLEEEENKQQEEMKIIFELLQVEPHILSEFLIDTENEFCQVGKILKNDEISSHDALIEIYQSVHSIKSNSVILGLNTFGDRLHALESKINIFRSQENISTSNMLNIVMDIEKLKEQKNKFNKTIEKIKTSVSESSGRKPKHLLIDTLEKTVNKTAIDLNKEIKFITDIDSKALKIGPRRIIKEVLIQLIRNSIVHGIELPEERSSNGKKQIGIIWLSIKMKVDKIHIKLVDDGKGLDYKKIAEKAFRLNLINPEEVNNENKLLKLIFTPGFSTADAETVHGGRGIGLSLVKDRLQDGKGSIKIKSKKGKGTVFHIYFPI